MVNRSEGMLLKRTLREFQTLTRYDPGDNIQSLSRRLGRPSSEILKLNANENFFIPQEFLRDLLREVIQEVDPRLYPGDETQELSEALGSYVNVSPDAVVVGTGADELISLVSQMLLTRGDQAISIDPTFSVYGERVRIQRANYKAIPLRRDFSLNIDKILSSATSKTKLFFLCSPNNPTANQFSREQITKLVRDFPGFLVIDEAYAEFAEDTTIDLITESQKVIVLRTFSKMFGLAGFRLGYAITNRRLASHMYKIQLPFSVSNIALRLALKLLQNSRTIRSTVEELKIQRTKLTQELNQIEGVHAFDSQTNFVLFNTKESSDDVHSKLLNKGIIIKRLGRVLQLNNCLRVTVAPSYMMEKFLTYLKEAL